MALDRADTLRNAEKLLRQGKLEPAIAEYLRVVEDQPRDWNSANTLGDLYVRAGQVDKALEQFVRIADNLTDEGLLPKATAIYKKILKLKPDHEHALLQAAEIAASQGLIADARANLRIVVEKRKARGDARGTAQVRIMLGGLDPADYPSRLDAASARVEIGDTSGAVRDFKEVAAELADQGRQAEAVGVLRQAALLQPADGSIRTQLFDLHVMAEEFSSAQEWATTKDQFRWLFTTLGQRGEWNEALRALREAVQRDPADAALRGQLARMLISRGDVSGAAEFLTEETADGKPQLLLMVAETRLREGRAEEGLGILRRLGEAGPFRREQIALLGCALARQHPTAGFQAVTVAAELSVANGDWAAAAAALREFVRRVPNHIAALTRLVDVCVDGRLEAPLCKAQALLADAYIAAGMGAEARAIAEELVAREPHEQANFERFRSALVLLGEPDPDEVIAERLSGQAPFTSTVLKGHEEAQTVVVPKADAAPKARAGAERQFELSANAVDIEGLLGELGSSQEAAREDAAVQSEPAEAADQAAPGADPPDRLDETDLETVFARLREEAARRSALGAAETDYRRGLALREQGDIEGCIEALREASKAAKLRFATASLLGRIYKQRGMMPESIEWFERAVQAPAPAPDEYHALLFELAEGLEATGEVARALAVYLELKADAGSYRDVDARVERLAKVQSRG